MNKIEQWEKLALQKIDWMAPFYSVLNAESNSYYKWFEGGRLNVSVQCIDRHLKNYGSSTAIIFEADDGTGRKITYNELSTEVNKFANLLTSFELEKGDRVVIYMPNRPEAVYAMLACARIGAICVFVFGGFSAEVLRERIVDVSPKLVITVDRYYRRGKERRFKDVVENALNIKACCSIKMLVIEYGDTITNDLKENEYSYRKLIKTCSEKCEPVEMDSESILFIMHTSGSTGKPKGIVHSTAGYILWAQYTIEAVFNLKPSDVFWCTADFGWITGHTYGIYGPLAVGATIVVYDGTSDYPDASRWWKMVEKYKVTQFYTAPTALRMLKKVDPNGPSKFNLSSLRVLGSVGETLDPVTWQWYYDLVGSNKCPIVDTWWQTETGGHIIAPIPNITKLKPGSPTMALPGISVGIFDHDGNEMAVGEKGHLCITEPWPSMLRGVWGDDKLYVGTYYNLIPRKDRSGYYYNSGDEAYRDKDGYIFITGRADDVMNISGHRIGSGEIEKIIMTHNHINEVAVVGCPDEITGEHLVAFVVVRNGVKINKIELLAGINALLVIELGLFIKLKNVVVVDSLPKTRSGKVLRRLLRSLVTGEEIFQDLSTLDDPAVVESVRNSIIGIKGF